MALSADTQLTIKNRLGQTRIDGVVLTSAVCYHHGLIARTAAGVLKPAASDTTLSFVGLCEIVNPDDSTAGITGDGTLRVECIGDIDVLIPCVTAITVGNVGSAAYAVDDQTITTEATLGPQVGIITEFVATNSVWVRLRAPAMAAGT